MPVKYDPYMPFMSRAEFDAGGRREQIAISQGEGKMTTTAVKHYRNDRLTVVAVYDPQLSFGEDGAKVLRVAIARASKNDNWSKKRGYQIAMGRLRCPRPGRKNVWEFDHHSVLLPKVIKNDATGYARIDLDRLLDLLGVE